MLAYVNNSLPLKGSPYSIVLRVCNVIISANLVASIDVYSSHNTEQAIRFCVIILQHVYFYKRCDAGQLLLFLLSLY